VRVRREAREGRQFVLVIDEEHARVYGVEAPGFRGEPEGRAVDQRVDAIGPDLVQAQD
jgi:hypothetical protein